MTNFPQQQFVNLHGQPITAIAAAPKRSSRPAAIREPKHKGFLAVGYSPEQLRQARSEHERVVERAADAGAPPVAPFDAEAYMRRAAPARIRSKPYEVPAAAHEACVLAARAGWLNCRVEQVVTK